MPYKRSEGRNDKKYMEFKERLINVRKHKCLTQKEISNILEIKQQQYRKYERGINIMLITIVQKICFNLKVSSEYLLGFNSKIKEIKVNKYNEYYNERIKEIREYRDQYQTDLAKLTDISVQEIHKYEKGIRIMSITNLTKICACLNISSNYILGFIDEMKPLDKNKRD